MATSRAAHISSIVGRYFDQFAEDYENMPFSSFENFSRDFIAWDEDKDKEIKMISRISPYVEALAQALYKEFKFKRKEE